MKEVELLSAAWYGDEPITINFPSSWDVIVVGGKNIPALTESQMRDRINNPIGGPRLSALAKGRNRAAIIIDDITRPTPTAKLIPLILEELEHAGMKQDSIVIVIASGTHEHASREDIIKKVGEGIADKIKVIPHNCKHGLAYLGKSPRGTPIYVNQTVMECDLKIGVGCLYPHGASGFSGGSKIIMPGVCGVETIHYMHYYLKGTDQRGGSLENDIRLEMEELAAKVGLDFIVNALLNQEREIAGLFAGDKILAHRQGVNFARELYCVNPVEDANIVVLNTYPFDTSLRFASIKGFWPLLIDRENKGSKVVIAACPMGLGHHELTPISTSLASRFLRRLKYIQLKEFLHLISRVRGLKKILKRRRLELMVLSTGITKEELKIVFPKAKLFGTWNELLGELKLRHRDLPVKVAVYPCSPLQMPAREGFSVNMGDN